MRTIDPSDEAAGFGVAHMHILNTGLGPNLIERCFEAVGANSPLDQDRSPRTIGLQGEGQRPKRLGELQVVVALARLTMDEDRTRGRQGVGIGERLVGKQEALIRADGEGLQAEPTWSVSRGHLRVSRMAVLGRLHGCSRSGSETFGNALDAVAIHGHKLGASGGVGVPNHAIKVRRRAMRMKAYGSFDEYLKDQSRSNQAIIRGLRRLVKRVEPGLSESVKWGNGCWIGSKGPVAYVYSAPDYVQFGFFRGSSLKDPKGLLEGKGKYVRHTKVHKPSRIDERSFAALLRQAAGE